MTASFSAGWRQVGASFVLLAACGMIVSTYSVIAVPLNAEFHPSRMVLMLAMTILSLVSGILSPFVGNLMDKVPLRLMMGIGAVALGLGFVALSFATSFTQVLVAFGALIAPANVLIGPIGATVLLSRWFVKRRGTAIGIAISGIALGGAVFPLVIQGLLEAFEWRTAFRVLGVILSLMTLAAVALIVDRPGDLGLHPDGDAQDSHVARAATQQAPLSVRAILTDPAFWLVGAVIGTVTSGMKGMVTNLAPMAIDEGIDATAAAFLVTVYASCGFIAKLSFAAVADKLHTRTLMYFSLGGFAAGAALLMKADAGYAVIAAGVALMGLFGGLMVPLQSLVVPRIFGQNVVGRASGLLSFALLCILLTTPPIFGRIFDVTGSYDAVFLAFAVLAVAVMLLVPLVRLHPRNEPAPGASPAPARA